MVKSFDKNQVFAHFETYGEEFVALLYGRLEGWKHFTEEYPMDTNHQRLFTEQSSTTSATGLKWFSFLEPLEDSPAQSHGSQQRIVIANLSQPNSGLGRSRKQFEVFKKQISKTFSPLRRNNRQMHYTLLSSK